MPEAPVRRPIRAFLLTPLIYILCCLLPVYIWNFYISETPVVGGRGVENLLSWGKIVLVYSGLIIYGCLLFLSPVYFLARRTRFEHPILPITLGFSVTALACLLMGNLINLSFLIYVMSGTFSGLLFWRLHSGKWWGRIEAS